MSSFRLLAISMALKISCISAEPTDDPSESVPVSSMCRSGMTAAKVVYFVSLFREPSVYASKVLFS